MCIVAVVFGMAAVSVAGADSIARDFCDVVDDSVTDWHSCCGTRSGAVAVFAVGANP